MAHPYLTVDDVIETIIVMLATHPMIQDPIVMNSAGTPLRINRICDSEHIYEFNRTGITLSIFPYTYYGTSNETVDSKNVAMRFINYDLGNASAAGGRDQVRLSLVVKIQIAGKQHEEYALNEGLDHQITVIRNRREGALYRWLPILRSILLTNPLDKLGGLITNSEIPWGSFRTTREESSPGTRVGGENIILHSASLVWSFDYFTARNYITLNQPIPQTNTGPRPSWTYIGVRSADCKLMYWDELAGFIVSSQGYPILTTPKNKRVVWDLDQSRFEDLAGVALTSNELLDNQTPPEPWIDTNLLIVGVLMPSHVNVFWNKTTHILQKCDGTPVTELPDGTPIEYDPDTGEIIDVTDPDNPVPVDNGGIIVVGRKGKVNIYDANSLKLRDSFEI